MNNFPPKLVGLGIDAVPQKLKLNVNENVINPKFPVESLVDGFSEEDYKSAIFLLMDYVKPENFMSLTNQDLPHLKAEFIKICQGLDETTLIELFGTLKMYKKLNYFKTCFHIYEYEDKRNAFSKIEAIWKVLYDLCEEMTDDDVKSLKQRVPESSRNYIQSAEDWFCWALNEKIFSRTDLSALETIFREYPNFVDIIKRFKDYTEYPLKVPSASSHCGIALILNYETFNKNSELEQRLNSDKDVDALKRLWKNFGFVSKDHQNLNRSETFKIIRDCAKADHSSFDAFVCCILSHGESNAVYSSDGILMEISELIKPITNDCPSLEHKPKLFFIQACQGPYMHQGAGKQVYCTKGTVQKASEVSVSPPPIGMDTLISNSSIDGSGRENYGDNAICYVQVKREGNICTVKARVIPEHSIHKKAYSVSFVCDEQEEEIISVKCEDCVASSGGCKHAIALLTWIHRRSEDPPFTATECYWKKSKLSNVGTQVKLLKAKDMKKKKSSQGLNSDYDADILPHLIEGSLRCGYAAFSKYWKSPSAVEKLSMHHLFSEFFSKKSRANSRTLSEILLI